jgi:hypothetical protein
MGNSISDLFNEVLYTPLETTKESLFGRIDQLLVSKNYFFILDYDTNSIFIFFKNGKFHTKISGGSVNKSESPIGIRSFQIDTLRSEVFFKFGKSKELVYNFDGAKIREVDVEEYKFKYQFSPADAVYSSFFRSKQPELTSNELVWRTDGRVIQRALPYSYNDSILSANDIINQSTSSFYPTDKIGIVAFTRPYDYTIYLLDANSIISTYSLVLPIDISLPTDFRTSRSYYGKRFNYVIREKPKLVHSINSIFIVGTNLFFKLTSSTNDYSNQLMYNFRSSTLYSIYHIDPDHLNYFLPTKSLVQTGILAASEQKIYSSISAIDLFKSYEQMRNKNIQYSQSLNVFFSSGTRMDNPVMITLTLKNAD